MALRDLMRDDPATVPRSASVREVANHLYQEDVGSVVVTEDGEPVGIVTERDIVVRSVFPGEDPDEVMAGDIMTQEPLCLEADSDVMEASEAVSGAGVPQLPVVEDDGQLAGTLAADDVSTLLDEEFGDLAAVLGQDAPP